MPRLSPAVPMRVEWPWRGDAWSPHVSSSEIESSSHKCCTISCAVYVSIPPSSVFSPRHDMPGTAEVKPFSKGPYRLTVEPSEPAILSSSVRLQACQQCVKGSRVFGSRTPAESEGHELESGRERNL
eukprot:2163992-Prymnesium_polylepis.1